MSDTAWEDHRWTGLPHLQGTERAEVCIIGLGGSGLSAVEHLVTRGVSVIAIDAGQVAGGAAGANGGFLLAGTARFYHQVVATSGPERGRDLYRMTIDEIDRMAADMPQIVRRVGSLRIAMSDEELENCNEQLAAMRADGLPVEHYIGPEGKGLLLPTDGVFNPLARCRMVAERCMQGGARLFEHSAAQDIGTGFVRTEQGLIRCKHVIACIDGKLDVVFPELGQRVRTARLQMLATAPTDEVSLSRPVYARWGYEYWQQLADGRVVLGGFRDQAMEREWTQSTETTEFIQTKLTRFLRDRLRVRAPIQHRWAASVGYTANGMPIVEQVRPKVWAVGGYNGTGNVIGALCARGVAQRVCGETSRWLDTLSCNS